MRSAVQTPETSQTISTVSSMISSHFFLFEIHQAKAPAGVKALPTLPTLTATPNLIFNGLVIQVKIALVILITKARPTSLIL
ncbi:hypothetical protein [Moraxella lacunata]|uniref:hypothetical protein n=1 Tax=Moraxella lacunata TaxID=477 RepID=UPI003EE00845